MSGGQWVDITKIRVGPISPEQRKAIDKFLSLSLAQHRRGTNVPRVSAERSYHVMTKPKQRTYIPSPEQVARLRELNRLKHEAAIARKQEAVARAFAHSSAQVNCDPVLRVPGGPEIAHRADGMREAYP